MTTIINVSVTVGAGGLPSGTFLCRPNVRHTDAVNVYLPFGTLFNIVNGFGTLLLEPTDGSWCWSISEQIPGGIIRYVQVPQSDTPVSYSTLVEIDPTTLQPSAAAASAWAVEQSRAMAAEQAISGTPNYFRTNLFDGGNF